MCGEERVVRGMLKAQVKSGECELEEEEEE
jgi:hypothetical protein